MNINENRLIDEFLELVQIDSSTKDERQMADVLIEKLQALNFTVTEDDAGEKIGGTTGNLIAVLDGDKQANPILFCAHMDRVQPGLGIKPQINNGIITSDGTTILAADDVAGIVAILEGIKFIQEQEIPHGRLEVLFTVAEEGGLFGAKNLDYGKLQAKAGYFLDAGGPVGTIVTQAPAQKNINFKVHGKAAHAGVAPERGNSALVVTAHALTKMRLGRIDEETTANIGIIQGGEATNIIPNLVSLKGEARSANGEKLNKQIEHMVEIMESTCNEHNTTVDIEINDSYDGFSLSSDDYVVTLALKSAEDVGLKPHLESTGGGSDANIINKYGIPSVILGMGYTDVHTTSETMPIDQLVAAAKYVVSIIKNS
ncbi:MAG: M20/M25/M40 family metallo-hydrolase [Bacillota bacterium]|nr:M20/M25/M40 family metallo-hydrolase [Bacillota bacterium]HHU60802.1 M20/M25/M40 family metallo-hydrolase [Natronincola sp.]